MTDSPTDKDVISPEDVAAVMLFSKRIREFRKRRGLTQAELAGLAGLAQSYVYALETESRNPSLHVLMRLASALKVGMRDLVPTNEYDEKLDTRLVGLMDELDAFAQLLSKDHRKQTVLVRALKDRVALIESGPEE